MPDVPYCGYVISVRARRLDSGRWAPHVTVRWTEFGRPQSRQVSIAEPPSLATAEEADALALRLGQQWVDGVN
jgi:hypothetical protein